MKVTFFVLAILIAEPNPGLRIFATDVWTAPTAERCFEMGAMVGGMMVAPYRIDPEGPLYDIECREVVFDLGGA
jgi:hypothetical protein